MKTDTLTITIGLLISTLSSLRYPATEMRADGQGQFEVKSRSEKQVRNTNERAS